MAATWARTKAAVVLSVKFVRTHQGVEHDGKIDQEDFAIDSDSASVVRDAGKWRAVPPAITTQMIRE